MPPPDRTAPLAALLAGLLAAPAAQAGPEASADRALETVAIVAPRDDDGPGDPDTASEGVVTAARLAARPLPRTGALLELIPGVAVTQHSGDGKANQYFLRGFDLDHGTDFSTRVDGVPVNLPTHAHGQGYTDLNFVIPELVRRIDYRKGPYAARDGDFSSAGAADIAYVGRLEAPFVALGVGEYRRRRLLGAGSTEVAPGVDLLGAVEFAAQDGPWTVPERLNRTNLVLLLGDDRRAHGWRLSLMHHAARWSATDQVPQRLLDAGQLDGTPFGRYDSLDPSDGGDTARTSLAAHWHRQADGRRTQVTAWALRYTLSLFSNFTYALERPDTGDQFGQRDDRQALGLDASHAVGHRFAGTDAVTEVGLQMRQDRIRVGLLDTIARQTTATVRDDRVRLAAAALYAQTSFAIAPWLRVTAGLRADQSHAGVDALSLPANGGQARATQVSPKLALAAGPWAGTALFFAAGRGFHSNDARGATATVDPRSGEPLARVPLLVPSTGAELGARTEWSPRLRTTLALWQLASASELVFAGDAGTTEPARASRRHGLEASLRWTPRTWLAVDADLAWSRARFDDADPAGDRIPNALARVFAVGATVRDAGPWSGALQWRYLGSAPLVEDGSVRSRAASTLNLRIARRMSSRATLALDVFNLLDRRVDDIQYFYTSRLPGEPAPVADRHVHPAEPRSLRLMLSIGL